MFSTIDAKAENFIQSQEHKCNEAAEVTVLGMEKLK